MRGSLDVSRARSRLVMAFGHCSDAVVSIALLTWVMSSGRRSI